MSSIGIATMGMFSGTMGTVSGGGGAPPYRQEYEEKPKPKILVTKVHFESKEDSSDKFENFTIKLLD